MTLWGGCFDGETDDRVRQFGDSIRFDHRLAAVDVRGSIAYAEALRDAGVLVAEEAAQIVAGLEGIADEIAAGTFAIDAADEDIHSAVERRLTERIGATAGMLHTGRSRNDQVATDLRLYLMDVIPRLRAGLADLKRVVVEASAQYLGVVMPGYTHLRPAQPMLFSHWLMSHFWKLERDEERLCDVERRVAVCPLGSGALAGTTYPIDRDALAARLGFSAASENSLDAVEDRDFVAELLTWAALLQVHLSSLAETLILWSSAEVGFVRLSEAYATGSSLMPQKRNPDALELLRGKAGRLIGRAAGFLCTLKGLPSGYNKDLQEDKEALFDTVDTVVLELPLAAALIRTLEVDAARMAHACDDELLATDLADYLVARGVPFRRSHFLVGQAVLRARDRGVPLRSLPPDEYEAIDPHFGSDLVAVFDLGRSLAARSARGGTATPAVEAQIDEARRKLAAAQRPRRPASLAP
ncbi:MAG: argininosuccinate lyase [Candidatus Bipolaricaulis sp.]|nr:argininosuccinate lyase [Candidatus Bipolaricaulis sp.]